MEESSIDETYDIFLGKIFSRRTVHERFCVMNETSHSQIQMSLNADVIVSHSVSVTDSESVDELLVNDKIFVDETTSSQLY